MRGMNNTRRSLPCPTISLLALRRASAAALAAAAIAGLASQAAAQGLDMTRYRMIDLTHPFEAETVYWPTVPSGFTLMTLSHGVNDKGFFYADEAFQAPEHGGTHMDAPLHFSQSGEAAEQVSLEHLIAPLAVIDVSGAAGGEADYEISVGDVVAYEAANGQIRRGSIVVARTGWSSRWPDRQQYLGDDTPGEAGNLHFPGFGAEAARLLVEQRGVAAIGIDTASVDVGKSLDFQVHRLIARANVPAFENLTGLERVPPKGASMLALPMMIKGGSGAPLRAVALVPR